MVSTSRPLNDYLSTVRCSHVVHAFRLALGDMWWDMAGMVATTTIPVGDLTIHDHACHANCGHTMGKVWHGAIRHRLNKKYYSLFTVEK